MKAASTESTRPNLHGLHLAPDGTTTATDGHKLIRVKPGPLETADYPEQPGWEAPTIPPDGIIIPTATALAALRAIPKSKQVRHIPILQHALVASVNGHVELSTTDLDTTKREQGRLLDGPYPNCTQIIPTVNPVFTVGFNAALLAEVLTTLVAMGIETSYTHQVRMDFYTPCGPCKITATTENGDEITAVVMPLRLKED